MTRALLLMAGLGLAACSNPIDPITDPEYQAQRAACTGGDFAACANAGHMAPLEAPEVVNAALRSFLNESLTD